MHQQISFGRMEPYRIVRSLCSEKGIWAFWSDRKVILRQNEALSGIDSPQNHTRHVYTWLILDKFVKSPDNQCIARQLIHFQTIYAYLLMTQSWLYRSLLIEVGFIGVNIYLFELVEFLTSPFSYPLGLGGWKYYRFLQFLNIFKYPFYSPSLNAPFVFLISKIFYRHHFSNYIFVYYTQLF